MEMGPDRVDGDPKCVGDLLVGAILLMKEDENGTLWQRETCEMLFNKLCELVCFKLLDGAAGGVLQAAFEIEVLIGEREVLAILAPAAGTLIVSHVCGDAIEVRGDLGLAAKVGECPEEPEKDVLRKVFQVGLLNAGAKQPSKGAEDHLLMVFYDLLEGDSAWHRLGERVRPENAGEVSRKQVKLDAHEPV
jgi:hypothetical protein